MEFSKIIWCFQWGAELRVFGYCDRICTIRCELILNDAVVLSGGRNGRGRKFSGVRSADGRTGGPYEIRVSENDVETVRLTGVYGGEVWLAQDRAIWNIRWAEVNLPDT